jgi:hypothetical protein
MLHVGDASVRGSPRPLLAMALAYLALASGIMIWQGLIVTPDYLLLILVPVALFSGNVVRFLADWVPFLALLLGWEAMRGIAGRGGIAPHTEDLASFEQRLFGGHLPTAELQSAVARTGMSLQVDYASTVVYFLHFVLPVAIALVLWTRDRRQFLRFTTTLVGMSFSLFVIYLLIPTGPPWYAQDQGFISGFRHVIGTTLPGYISPYYAALNPNRFAALPSLHAAYPFLGFLALRKVSAWAAAAALGWAVIVWLTVVYLGDHYVIDVAAGVVTATVAWTVMTYVVAPRLASLRDPVSVRKSPLLSSEETPGLMLP